MRSSVGDALEDKLSQIVDDLRRKLSLVLYVLSCFKIIIARIRRMTAGYVFAGVCLSNFRGGIPHPADEGQQGGGNPHPPWWGGTPILSDQDWTGVTPPPPNQETEQQLLQALTARREVCFLRSRRRTVLYFESFILYVSNFALLSVSLGPYWALHCKYIITIRVLQEGNIFSLSVCSPGRRWGLWSSVSCPRSLPGGGVGLWSPVSSPGSLFRGREGWVSALWSQVPSWGGRVGGSLLSGQGEWRVGEGVPWSRLGYPPPCPPSYPLPLIILGMDRLRLLRLPTGKLSYLP